MEKKTSTPAEIPVAPPLLYPVLTQSPNAPPSPKKAVFITHGMGQQKEFETLHQVVQGLRRAAESDGTTISEQVRFVQIGSERLYRVELEIQSQGEKQRVDLYEAYWAPLTEGKVNFRDVMRFLWSAGISGMLNSFRPPHPIRFGQKIRMSGTWRTMGLLVLSLAILLALVVMNASIVAVGSARSLFVGESEWLTESLFENLSVVFNILLIFVIPLGSLLALVSIRKSVAEGGAVLGIYVRCVIWSCLVLTTAATLLLGIENLGALLAARPETSSVYIAQLFPSEVFLGQLRAGATSLGLLSLILLAIGYLCRSAPLGSGAVFVLLFATCLWGQVYGLVSILAQFNHNLLPVLLTVSTTVYPESWPFLRWSFWLWPFLLLAAAQIRTVMVQYVGDVAAYISPDQLDRFTEIRGKIKEQARRTAAAIYSAQDLVAGGFEYCQVVFVGHSLGSVISYDTLNRLIKDDELAEHPREVLGRTNLLLTFGSPLDKTSFVFALRGRSSAQTRDSLVAAVQPLIQDYRYRPFPWVNVWSPHDVISGKLDYFDADPADPNHAVKNERDPEASIPLVAHTEYWKNRLVWERLYAALV